MNEEEKEEELSITVRLVSDTKTGTCWFEEKLKNKQWIKIPCTDMACEGNSRSKLNDWIENLRQQRLMIFRKYGDEQTIKVG